MFNDLIDVNRFVMAVYLKLHHSKGNKVLVEFNLMLKNFLKSEYKASKLGSNKSLDKHISIVAQLNFNPVNMQATLLETTEEDKPIANKRLTFEEDSMAKRLD